MNRIRTSLYALALLPTLALADMIENPADVAERLDAEGFTAIVVHDFDGLLWQAEAVDRTGQPVLVRINPADGTIQTTTRTVTPVATVPVPQQPLNEADVRQLLAAAGYHDIDDVELRDGLWRAEAEDASGQDYELKVDPGSGRIVSLDED